MIKVLVADVVFVVGVIAAVSLFGMLRASRWRQFTRVSVLAIRTDGVG